MSWDIYGEPLRRGHCEVHPHVHEEYPCSVCIADKRSSEQQGGCRGGCESEHLLGLAREHVKELEQERDALAAHMEEGKTLVHELLVADTTDDATHLTEWAEIETANQSLARMKAQWQADAVSEFALHHLGGHEQEVAEIYASRLRRQAEGGEV